MNAPTIPPRHEREWTEAELAAWAAEHPVGTPVRYWPLRGCDDEYRDVRIRSAPWLLCHVEQAVVKIEGTAGGVALDHLAKLEGELPPYDPTKPYLVHAHELVMQAKVLVIRGQDALTSFANWLPDNREKPAPNERLARKLEKRLAKLRADLEALDREYFARVEVRK